MQEFTNGNDSGSIEELFYEAHHRHLPTHKPYKPVSMCSGEPTAFGVLSDEDVASIGTTEGVYVLVNESQTYAKIGRTTNLLARLTGLSTANPEKLSVHRFYVCRESRKLEALLHGWFAKARTNGEWFHATILPELREMKVTEFCSHEYRSHHSTRAGMPGPFDEEFTEEVAIRTTMEVNEACRVAAELHGSTQSAFVRAILDRWVRRGGTEDRPKNRLPNCERATIRVMASPAFKRNLDHHRNQRGGMTLGASLEAALELYREALAQGLSR